MTELDIGCGDHKVINTIGIDKNPNSKADIILDVYLNPLPFKNCSINSVYLKETIEHLENPIYTLKEIHRVLEYNGLLLISCPNVYEISFIIRWIFRAKKTVSQEHIFSWTKPELINILEKTGFEIFYVSFITYKYYYKRTIINNILNFLNLLHLSERSIVIEAYKK